MGTTRRTALVVVDHGSRNAESNEALDRVVCEVRAICGERYAPVLAAHMDLVSPTIDDAFAAAAAAGAELVVLCLYFLGPGRHSAEDVPRLAKAAAARHPGLDFVISAPLGPDPALFALLLERALEAALRAS
jgi:sirohydrochlorin ferrochelatase